MAYHPIPTIQFLVGPDKVSEATRYERGVKVSDQAPKSPLYIAHGDLKAAADGVIAETAALKGKMDAYSIAHAEYITAGTALRDAVISWDGTYDVFTRTAEKYSVSPNDIATMGGEARGKNHYLLAMPLAVLLTYDAKKDLLRVHVTRAPGMRALVVQLSQEPITPTSWVEQPGNGALHTVPHPAKGTWWGRAASKTAKAMSDFTTPVSVIVK